MMTIEKETVPAITSPAKAWLRALELTAPLMRNRVQNAADSC